MTLAMCRLPRSPTRLPTHPLPPLCPRADKGLMWETMAGYARQVSPQCATNVVGGLLPLTYRLYHRDECQQFFRLHMAPREREGRGGQVEAAGGAGASSKEHGGATSGVHGASTDVVGGGQHGSCVDTDDSWHVAPGGRVIVAGGTGGGLAEGRSNGELSAAPDGTNGGSEGAEACGGAGGAAAASHGPPPTSTAGGTPLGERDICQRGALPGRKGVQGGAVAGAEATNAACLAADEQAGARTGHGEEDWWILKLNDMSAGQGTFLLVPSVNDSAIAKGMRKKYGPKGERCAQVAAEAPPDGRRTREQMARGLAMMQVAQRYVRDALLIDGRKFHIRIYALVVSVAPMVVVYSHRAIDNYVLITPYAYDARNWVDLDGHLTSGRLPPTRENNRNTGSAHAAAQRGKSDTAHIEGNGSVTFDAGGAGAASTQEAAPTQATRGGHDDGASPSGVDGTQTPGAADHPEAAGGSSAACDSAGKPCPASPRLPYVRPARMFTGWWTLGELDEYLSAEAGAVPAGYVERTLVPQLQAAIVFTMRALEARITSRGDTWRQFGATTPAANHDSSSADLNGTVGSGSGAAGSNASGSGQNHKYLHYYQLFAFDFMLNTYLEPILLEVNSNPGLLEPGAVIVNDLVSLAQELFEAKLGGRWPTAATLSAATSGSHPPYTSMYARDILDLSRFKGELHLIMDGDWEIANIEGCRQFPTNRR
eukprot:jgi/Mesvir1/12573/Mv19466-RA.1